MSNKTPTQPAQATHVMLPANVWRQVADVLSERPYRDVAALFTQLQQHMTFYKEEETPKPKQAPSPKLVDKPD